MFVCVCAAFSHSDAEKARAEGHRTRYLAVQLRAKNQRFVRQAKASAAAPPPLLLPPAVVVKAPVVVVKPVDATPVVVVVEDKVPAFVVDGEEGAQKGEQHVPLACWTRDDVARWLASIGFAAMIDEFSDVSGAMLVVMRDADIADVAFLSTPFKQMRFSARLQALQATEN
jgi:hypothetical protein